MSLISWLNREGPTVNISQIACDPLSLPKGGTIILNSTFSVTLDQNAIFQPFCEDGSRPEPIGPATVLDLQDPFYASTSPQLYAIATATVVSYLLVIMLFITPRTFFIGGRGGGFLSRRGMISGSYGSSSVVGVGGRPWLQKVAALTVAISLTLATVHSFRVAKEQYDMGYMDSNALTNEVLNGLEIRVVRVISGTFLWLAQVQTLIRLFPRHKEKVIIKWVGFALIMLDTIFTILNNFVNKSYNTFQAKNIVQAIPALNYLFELSLSLLYAAWVIFYSLSKRRFAFFHAKMKNICLVAIFSLIAVLIPFSFFIVDLSKPILSSWGEYIRWVGAAAASVVVWEWVERIEALEREERKDGILGREIFDGDEMLDVTPSHEVDWPGPRRGGNDGGGGPGTASGWANRIGFSHRPLTSRVTFANRLPRPQRRRQIHHLQEPESDPTTAGQTVTPSSRADTASVASTVYRVRYHSEPSPAPSISGGTHGDGQSDMEKEFSIIPNREGVDRGGYRVNSPAPVLKKGLGWLSFFTRRRGSPPEEVATAQAEEGRDLNNTADKSGGRDENSGGLSNLRSTTAGLRSFFHKDSGSNSEAPQRDETGQLPVTVIPARPRQHSNNNTSETTRASPASASVQASTRQHLQPHHERSESQQRSNSLPVMVIPAQPRSPSRTWSNPGTTRESPFADQQHSPADRHSPRLSFALPNSHTPQDSAVRSAGSGRDRERENFATVTEEEGSAEGCRFSSSPTAMTSVSRRPSNVRQSAHAPGVAVHTPNDDSGSVPDNQRPGVEHVAPILTSSPEQLDHAGPRGTDDPDARNRPPDPETHSGG